MHLVLKLLEFYWVLRNGNSLVKEIYQIYIKYKPICLLTKKLENFHKLYCVVVVCSS